MNYYNEINPAAAAWLRELIRAGEIPVGVVDERSIVEVQPHELTEYIQCHFFAGIGGWSYALKLAKWPADRPVWTGSCPCQPFSCAGKGLAEADERHLWPFFRNLIGNCRPSVVFGEQVASAAGKVWLAGIRADLEILAYAVGAADLCAAGVSAPHVRQRLYWVADADSARRAWTGSPQSTQWLGDPITVGAGKTYRLSNSQYDGQDSKEEGEAKPKGDGSKQRLPVGTDSRVGDSNRYHEHWWSGPLQVGRNCIAGEITRGGRKQSAQWRIKPGLSILADGIPGRVEQLCGFGNAIVPQVAAEFIAAFDELISSNVDIRRGGD